MDDGGDDDIIIDDNNNDENDEAKKKSDQVIYDVLEGFVEPITLLLETENDLTTRVSSFNDHTMRNLGVLKLRAIELLSTLISLKKPQINDQLVKNSVCASLLDHVQEHPWNNFIQLKIHQIFEDYLESENSLEQKLQLIKKSDVLMKLIKMSETPEVTFGTGNNIRNGYMGFVIHLATKIKKVTQAEKLNSLAGAELVFTSDWDQFLSGEFERSTTQNEKSLGGRTAQMADDDEETSFDVNMDKIMQRFKCFNQVSVSNNSEDEDTNKDDTDDTSKDDDEPEDTKVEVILP